MTFHVNRLLDMSSLTFTENKTQKRLLSSAAIVISASGVKPH